MLLLKSDVSKTLERLKKIIEGINSLSSRAERIETLISLADKYHPVESNVASPPYSEEHRVQDCESEVYVWTVQQKDGSIKLHFAVENPQGVSAMALAAILDEGLSGSLPEEIAEVSEDVVYEIFGNEISLGKSMGLTGIVRSIKREASKFIS